MSASGVPVIRNVRNYSTRHPSSLHRAADPKDEVLSQVGRPSRPQDGGLYIAHFDGEDATLDHHVHFGRQVVCCHHLDEQQE